MNKEYIKKWFEDNGIAIPKTVQMWQAARVTKGEIPPGCAYATLRQLGSIAELINYLHGDTITKVCKNNPITPSNIRELLGLIWTSDSLDKDGIHKSVETQCCSCSNKETLSYSTLSRMHARKDKLCRLCRNVGGKKKPINAYTMSGFTTTSVNSDSTVSFQCHACKNSITRSMAHVTTAEYFVCQHCSPGYSHRLTNELGTFDSTIEYLVYKDVLLKYVSISEIHRQVMYKNIFPQVTSMHRCDFHIPKLDLVLEVTTSNNNYLRYQDTVALKEAISDKVVFVYSVKQADDIVQSRLKNRSGGC